MFKISFNKYCYSYDEIQRRTNQGLIPTYIILETHWNKNPPPQTEITEAATKQLKRTRCKHALLQTRKDVIFYFLLDKVAYSNWITTKLPEDIKKNT